MKRKATFYASPEFVRVEEGGRKLSWRERWLGVTWEHRAVPHPDLVRLAPGVYFGHPETVERVKADVLKLKEIADGSET